MVGTVLQIQAHDTLQGDVVVPGDKSISHRALLLGAIANGPTTIEGILASEDPCSTAACLRALGVTISPLRTEAGEAAPLVTVTGVGLDGLQEPVDILDAGNSGTTLRLILGMLAAQAGKFFAITGDQSLRSRPMGRVVTPLSQMGATIWGRQQGERAPLAIRGEALKGIRYATPVASAQIKSCVLLAGLWGDQPTTVTEPALSRDHSERMLKAFGATLTTDPAAGSVTLAPRPQLQGQAVIVPGDPSSAAFWLVAAAIAPAADLLIQNVGINPTRTGLLTVLAEMGADLALENVREVAGEPLADLRIRASQLRGTTIAGDMIPKLIDEIPILAVAAAFATGPTRIRDAAELRVKESDRLQAMASQLSRLGVKITEVPDGLDIEGQGDRPLQGTVLEAFGDHRVAMSLAIAALRATGSTQIRGAECIDISYPTFYPHPAAIDLSG